MFLKKKFNRKKSKYLNKYGENRIRKQNFRISNRRD